ncbi:MAG TPA: hypothetical protein VFH20_12775 [Propionibacteriaceae bacterium]|nr:hypothetical protein [Propionibacteriaceae bacterium]
MTTTAVEVAPHSGRFIAVAAGRLVVGRAVKGGAEDADGVALKAQSDVGLVRQPQSVITGGGS